MWSKGMLVWVDIIGAVIGVTGLGFNIASLSVDCMYDQHDVGVHLQMHPPFLRIQCVRLDRDCGACFQRFGSRKHVCWRALG